MSKFHRLVFVGLLVALCTTNGGVRFGDAADATPAPVETTSSPATLTPTSPDPGVTSPAPVGTTPFPASQAPPATSPLPAETTTPGAGGDPEVTQPVDPANPNGTDTATNGTTAPAPTAVTVTPTHKSNPNTTNKTIPGKVSTLKNEVPSSTPNQFGDWALLESFQNLPQSFRVSPEGEPDPISKPSFMRVCSIGDAVVGKTICVNEKGVQQIQGNSSNASANAVVGVKSTGGINGTLYLCDVTKSKFWAINETGGTLSFDVEEASATKFRIYQNPKIESLLIVADGQDGPFFLSASSKDKDPLQLSRHITTNSMFVSGIAADGNNIDIIQKIDQSILESRRAALANLERSPFWISYDLALAMPMSIDTASMKSNKLSALDISQWLRKTFKLIVDLRDQDYSEFVSLGKDFPFKFDLASLASKETIKLADANAWRDGFGLVDMPTHADRRSIIDWLNYLGRKFNSTTTYDDMSLYGYDSNAITISLLSKAVLSATKFSELVVKSKSPVFLDPKNDTMASLMRDYYDSSCGLAVSTTKNLTLAQKIELVELPCNHTSSGAKGCGEVMTQPIEKDNNEYWFSKLLLHYLDPDDEVASVTRMGLLKFLPDDFVNTKGIFTDPLSGPAYEKIDSVVNVDGINLKLLYTDFIDAKTRQLIDVAETFCATRDLHIDLCTIPTILRQISLTQAISRNISDPNQITDIAQSASMDYKKYFSSWQQEQQNKEFMQNLDSIKKVIKDFSYNSSEAAAEEVKNTTAATSGVDKATFDSIAKGFNKIRTDSSALDVQQKRGEIKQKMDILRKNFQIAEENQKPFGDTLKGLAQKANVMQIADAVVSGIQAVCNTASAFSGVKNGDASGADAALATIGTVKQSYTEIRNAVKMSDFVDYVEKSINEMEILFKKLAEAFPKLEQISKALRPFEDEKSLSDAELQVKSQELLQVLGNYRFPVREEEMEALQLRIRTIGDKLCLMIETTDQNCVKLAGLHEKLFGGLMDAVQANQQLLDTSSQYAVTTIQARTANTLQQFLEGNSTESIKPKGNGTAKATSVSPEESKRLGRYWLSLSKLALIQNQLTLYTTALHFCDRRTYLAGGIVDSDCKSIVYEAKMFDGKKVGDFVPPESSVKATTTLSFRIPTANSSAFLDLRKLMSGGKTYFQFPMNDPTWYVTNRAGGPLYDPKNSYYVSKFQVMIPPVSASPQQPKISVVIKSAGTTNLGNGKNYQIPTQIFVNDYQNGASTDGQCRPSPYGCQNMQYCYSSKGDVIGDLSLPPSLHSVWEFSMNHTGSDQAIAYDKAITDVPVYAELSVSIPRAQRRMQSSASDAPGTGTPAPSSQAPASSVPASSSQAPGPESPAPSSQIPGSTTPAPSQTSTANETASPGPVPGPTAQPLNNTDTGVGSETPQSQCCPADKNQFFSPTSRQCTTCPEKSTSVMGLFCVLDGNAAGLSTGNFTSTTPSNSTNETLNPMASSTNTTPSPTVLPNGTSSVAPGSPPSSSSAAPATSSPPSSETPSTAPTSSPPAPSGSAGNSPAPATGGLPSTSPSRRWRL